MALSRQDDVKIAALARLELDEGEVEPMLRDLARILAYVEQLSELDTRDVRREARTAGAPGDRSGPLPRARAPLARRRSRQS